MIRFLFTLPAIASLLLVATPARANLGIVCNHLRNFMLTTDGRCLNLDYLINGGASPTSQNSRTESSQKIFGVWEVINTTIAYQGDQGMRRVRIILKNGGMEAATPVGVQYRITEGGNELYQGSILNTSIFAPNQSLTLETLVGPDSLRGSRIGDLKVEVLSVIN